MSLPPALAPFRDGQLGAQDWLRCRQAYLVKDISFVMRGHEQSN